jgi:hypothetical protein
MKEKEIIKPIHNSIICCGVLERMDIGWMKLDNGDKGMPYIRGNNDENLYRINNCPSCGKYVRDIIIKYIAPNQC